LIIQLIDPRLMIEPPPSAHVRCNGLCREELMPQIDGNAGVPTRYGDIVHVMAMIVRCVVDENPDRTEMRSNAFDRRLQRADVAQVAGDEQRIVRTVPSQRRREGVTCVLIVEHRVGSASEYFGIRA
jgi:hypothetical protein